MYIHTAQQSTKSFDTVHHDKELVDLFHHCMNSAQAQKLHDVPLFRIVNYQQKTHKSCSSLQTHKVSLIIHLLELSPFKTLTTNDLK